jgi:hypothetical protein
MKGSMMERNTSVFGNPIPEPTGDHLIQGDYAPTLERFMLQEEAAQQAELDHADLEEAEQARLSEEEVADLCQCGRAHGFHTNSGPACTYCLEGGAA